MPPPRRKGGRPELGVRRLCRGWLTPPFSPLWRSGLGGVATHTGRIAGLSSWTWHAVPKPRRLLGLLLFWRPLCLCGARFKLYDRRLWTAVPRSMQQQLAPHLFAFRLGRRGMHTCEMVRCAKRKANECGFPLYVASLDAETASGQVEAYMVEGAMLAHDAPAWASRPCCGSTWISNRGRSWLALRLMARFRWGTAPDKSGRALLTFGTPSPVPSPVLWWPSGQAIRARNGARPSASGPSVGCG